MFYKNKLSAWISDLIDETFPESSLYESYKKLLKNKGFKKLDYPTRCNLVVDELTNRKISSDVYAKAYVTYINFTLRVLNEQDEQDENA